MKRLSMTGEEARDRIHAALEMAADCGQIDGDWHKAWVIDQMVRALAGDAYLAWVGEYCLGDEEDNPEDTYTWSGGIAP